MCRVLFLINMNKCLHNNTERRWCRIEANLLIFFKLSNWALYFCQNVPMAIIWGQLTRAQMSHHIGAKKGYILKTLLLSFKVSPYSWSCWLLCWYGNKFILKQISHSDWTISGSVLQINPPTCFTDQFSPRGRTTHTETFTPVLTFCIRI